MPRMDADFFKHRLRSIGGTADDLARAIGRDRTVISHIYAGKRRLRPEEVEAFARVLNLPIETVLEKAGLASAAMRAMTEAQGLAEDASPFDHRSTQNASRLNAMFGLDRPGVDVWRIRSPAMLLGGYREGDLVVVDSHRAGSWRKGDDILAQVYDLQTGSAVTVFRRAEPPFIFALSPFSHLISPMLVDGERVLVRGVVTASWRTMDEAA